MRTDNPTITAMTVLQVACRAADERLGEALAEAWKAYDGEVHSSDERLAESIARVVALFDRFPDVMSVQRPTSRPVRDTARPTRRPTRQPAWSTWMP